MVFWKWEFNLKKFIKNKFIQILRPEKINGQIFVFWYQKEWYTIWPVATVIYFRRLKNYQLTFLHKKWARWKKVIHNSLRSRLHQFYSKLLRNPYKNNHTPNTDIQNKSNGQSPDNWNLNSNEWQCQPHSLIF